MTKSIYLCGPIAGTDWETSARGWREQVHNELPEFDVFSPMRGKDFLREIKKGEVFSTQSYDQSPISTTQGILGRDFNDVNKCDLIFANFLGAKERSIGSISEIAWAWAMKKPIILCMEKEKNPHDHLFIKGMVTYNVQDLTVGIDLARYVLTPGL